MYILYTHQVHTVYIYITCIYVYTIILYTYIHNMYLCRYIYTLYIYIVVQTIYSSIGILWLLNWKVVYDIPRLNGQVIVTIPLLPLINGHGNSEVGVLSMTWLLHNLSVEDLANKKKEIKHVPME